MVKPNKLVEAIPGVSIRIFQADTEINLSNCNEGNIGRLTLKEPVLLVLRVLPLPEVIRTIFTLRYAPKDKGSTLLLVPIKKVEGVYHHTVPIHSSNSGTAYVKYPENHVKLLEVTRAGAVTMWEVAIASEWGTSFLTIQPTYQTLCYQDSNGEPVCPLIDNSPVIMMAIRQSLKGRTQNLPSIEDYVPPRDFRDTSLFGLPENCGLVIWWNEAMRMGMIRTAEGEAVRVLGINIQTKRLYRTFLVPGEIIRYKKLKPTKSRTRFGFDAVGITM